MDEAVQEAIKQGARLLGGGRRAAADSKSDSLVYLPTVLADVTQDMKIASTEVFGPCMTIIKFRTEQDLVAMVTATAHAARTHSRQQCVCV